MYLRLKDQAAYLADEGESWLPDFQSLASKRTDQHGIKLDLQAGRPSPLGSASLGAAVMRILTFVSNPHSNTEESFWKCIEDDIAALQEAVQIALQQEPVVPYRGHLMGGDEVLYGRAGLLWAILNLRNHVSNAGARTALDPVFAPFTSHPNLPRYARASASPCVCKKG